MNATSSVFSQRRRSCTASRSSADRTGTCAGCELMERHRPATKLQDEQRHPVGLPLVEKRTQPPSLSWCGARWWDPRRHALDEPLHAGMERTAATVPSMGSRRQAGGRRKTTAHRGNKRRKACVGVSSGLWTTMRRHHFPLLALLLLAVVAAGAASSPVLAAHWPSCVRQCNVVLPRPAAVWALCPQQILSGRSVA